MSRSIFTFAAVLGSSFISAACTRTLVVTPHAMRCNVPADLISYSCPSPKPIPEDSTFQAIVDVSKDDRQALNECGTNLAALRDSLNKCNRALDEFNKKIDEINAQNDKN